MGILEESLTNITSLKVRKPTRDHLARLGNKTETFDDIINRLIDFYEKNSIGSRVANA
jgi:hypothetical protein